MNLRIIGGVAVAILLAWPTLVLAGGEMQQERSPAGECGPFLVASAAASAGGQSRFQSAAPGPVQADHGEMVAQVNLEKCVACCTRNQQACAKNNGQYCELKHTKCVAHCNKGGNMPSDWFCWWQPQMTW